VGFPNSKQEAWRWTNVSELAKTDFALARRADARNLKNRFSFGKQAAAEIVFVNGHFSPELSDLSGLPRGVQVSSLAEAIEKSPAVVQKHLGKHAKIGANPFVALNQGFLADGAFVHIARGALVERPLHLLFLGVPAVGPTACHPRTLVIAEENCEATLVETYAGSDHGVYFTNAVTEIVTAPTARLDHCKLNQEGKLAYHVATMQVNLEARSSFISHAITLGGKLTRNDLNCYMGGEYAEATLNGLVILKGDQHCDNHTLLHHEKAHCPSHELYKHVLDGQSSAVFKGQIFVQKDAQKTDSKQTSKSLLLSGEATINSQPALEIYADDVKCTHGSTIGPVDESAIFYLQSRGLSYETSRHLLTYAFAADITRRIRVAPVRARVEDFMAAQHGLPQDLRITEEADAHTKMM
jgi:Fe-S cluster assembly protein SufD